LAFNARRPQRTYNPNPGIFLAHSRGLRIAASLRQPTILSCTTRLRAAIVGRYEDIPRLRHQRRPFPNVYARSDYHEAAVMLNSTTNEIYYNHVWPPHSPADRLSAFGLRNSLAGAPLCSPFALRPRLCVICAVRLYGDRPGQFMGDDKCPVMDAPTHRPYRRPTGKLRDRLWKRSASIWLSVTSQPNHVV